MKVVAILGSPRRKGNSSGLAETLTSLLTEKGFETKIHNLNSLNYKGCQACEGCKLKSEVCVVRDDLSAVLEDVKLAEVVILATPVYWGEVSAQMKGFIDRTYSYLTPEFMTGPKRHRLSSGKKLVFITSQGGDEALYDNIFPRYNGFFVQLEMFEETYLIRGCELSGKDDYQSRSDLSTKVKETVEAIISFPATPRSE